MLNSFPDHCLSKAPTLSLCGHLFIHLSMQRIVHQGMPGCVWNVVQDQAGGELHA